MSKKVLIVGGEGHGSVIASCINDNRKRFNDNEWEVAGYVNDFESIIDEYPVIGKTEDIPNLVKDGYYFAWGIHLIGKNPLTHKTFEKMNIPIHRLATIIHHSAFIGDYVDLEPGVFVMANAYIAPRAHIGLGTMIKANACIGHDVVCGPLCHFAMGSITGSFTKIGTCSDIAIGSVTLEKLNIGSYSMLGAHSLLTHDIPDGKIYVGNPATYFKDIISNDNL